MEVEMKLDELNTKVIERIEAKIAAGEIETNEVIALTMLRALPAIEEIAAQLKAMNQTIDNTVARFGSSL
jgi:VIT1/CCC1 family predicted Fe2+/Mn2+ transporter